MKPKIRSIEFSREIETSGNIPQHKIIIHLRGEIPAIGFGSKEIRKMLKRWEFNKLK